jgi:hypothetical protein
MTVVNDMCVTKCVCVGNVLEIFMTKIRTFGKMVISWSKLGIILHLSMQETCPSAVKQVFSARNHVKRSSRGCFRCV